MSKKSIILIIAIMVLAFAAGWGLYMWFSYPQQQNVQMIDPERIPVTSDSFNQSPGPGFRQMVNVLDLSASQTNEFHKIESRYRQNMHRYTQQLDSIDLAILEEIKSENPDQEELDSMAARTGEIQHTLKKATTDHFVQIKELCTPAQREKFNEVLSDIHRFRKGRGPGFGRGQGRQQGRGRRWNNR